MLISSISQRYKTLNCNIKKKHNANKAPELKHIAC